MKPQSALHPKRPLGLIAIVLYKGLMVVLFSVTAIALLTAVRNYEGLAAIADVYTLEGKHQIITWILEKLLNLNPKTLQFSGLAAGGYAAVSLVEAIGLWLEKPWAHWLVVGLVAISIPPEIYELIRGITLVKAIVFAINIAMFWYLLKHLPKRRRRV